MTTAAEAAAAKSQLAADIAAGVNTLSLDQSVTFTKYVRLVLPLDGFVFWVRADLISQSALLNAAKFNKVKGDQAPTIITPAPTLIVKGSLHYGTTREQNEDATYAQNTVVFTALGPVQDFNQIGPNVVYIATFGPDNIRFAFSQRKPFYAQADTYHYSGSAVYSTMLSQIVDHPAQFDGAQLVVSNSLPFWLALSQYAPNYVGFTFPTQLFPSYALPDNLPPPYASVHIAPEGTRALQSVPYLDSSLGHHQLAHDNVRITTYGLNNAAIMNFMDCVNQYSLDTDNFGIMNMPIARDDKKTQSELAILAMKKVIDFEISYNQFAVRNAARQLIETAIVSYQFGTTVLQLRPQAA